MAPLTLRILTPVFVLLLLLSAADPASAQDDPPADGSAEEVGEPEPAADPEPVETGDPTEPIGSLLLINQSASVPSDGELQVTLDWTGEVREDLAISVLFHQRIETERDVGAPSSSILNRRAPVAMTTLPTDPDGNLVLTVPVRSVSPAENDRVYLPGPGVYPFTVEVRSTDGLVSSVSSNLVRLPQDTSTLETIDLAVILALSPADGLDLSDGILFLSSYPEIPFTIQVDGGVLTTLESEPALAEQFAAAAAGRPVLSDAGVDLDPSALAEIDQGRFFFQAKDATASRIADLGLTPSAEILMLSSVLTAPGAELLASAGVQAVLTTSSIEVGTGTISTSKAPIQVIQPDRPLSEELSASALAGFVATDIYELYARLSLRADLNRTSVILGGEGAAVLDSQSLDSFLATLTEEGALRPVSLLDAVNGLPRSPLQPAERPEQNLLDSGEAIAELQQLAETSRSFRGVENRSLERLLVDSLSRTRNPADRARAINRAKSELLLDLATISLPAAQSLTLAAVEGPLPLTIQNSADGSRLVRLEFRGDRVSIAEDGDVITVPPGETTIDLQATARALGVSTLEVTALTPDGQRVLSTSRYEIRSTAVPGLGWAISGTALAFLLLWWLRNARKSGPRRQHLVGVPKDVGSAETPSAGRGIAADAVEAL